MRLVHDPKLTSLPLDLWIESVLSLLKMRYVFSLYLQFVQIADRAVFFPESKSPLF